MFHHVAETMVFVVYEASQQESNKSWSSMQESNLFGVGVELAVKKFRLRSPLLNTKRVYAHLYRYSISSGFKSPTTGKRSHNHILQTEQYNVVGNYCYQSASILCKTKATIVQK